MKTAILSIHGINTVDADYGAKFWANLARLKVQADFRTVFWGSGMNDEIRRWAVLYREPKYHWWSLVGRLLAPVVVKLKTSLFWVRQLETMRHEIAISDTVISEIKAALEDGAERLIFVAHSLGSIVAVQAIKRAIAEDIVTEKHIFGIVTLGAALSQWREPRELQRILKDIPVDRWINIYDEFDFIAGPMAPIDARVDDRIARLRGWLSSHVRYWDSMFVARVIATLATPIESEPPKPLTQNPPPPPPPPQTPSIVPETNGEKKEPA